MVRDSSEERGAADSKGMPALRGGSDQLHLRKIEGWNMVEKRKRGF